MSHLLHLNCSIGDNEALISGFRDLYSIQMGKGHISHIYSTDGELWNSTCFAEQENTYEYSTLKKLIY